MPVPLVSSMAHANSVLPYLPSKNRIVGLQTFETSVPSTTYRARQMSSVSVRSLKSRSVLSLPSCLKKNEMQVISPLLVCLGQEIFYILGFWNIFIYTMRYLGEETQVCTPNLVVFPINTYPYHESNFIQCFRCVCILTMAYHIPLDVGFSTVV